MDGNGNGDGDDLADKMLARNRNLAIKSNLRHVRQVIEDSIRKSIFHDRISVSQLSKSRQAKLIFALFEKQPVLVAVSKTMPSTDIEDAYELGQRDFGENYVRVRVRFDHTHPRWCSRALYCRRFCILSS
jgi:hypothetical protein